MSNLFLTKPMNQEELRQKLMLFTPRNITLILNQNHSTFLSVLEKKRKDLRLSLHRFFLFANDLICESVIRYCLRRDREALKLLRIFTNKHFMEADYSDKVNPNLLVTSGKHYDLHEIYQGVNAKYFQNKMDLSITWFKKPRYKTFSSLTYGSYSKPLKLIRINDILDQKTVPFFFVEYIVFHEMLHHICPPKIDTLGRSRVHTPLFKKREKNYEHYDQAIQWEKKSAYSFHFKNTAVR